LEVIVGADEYHWAWVHLLAGAREDPLLRWTKVSGSGSAWPTTGWNIRLVQPENESLVNRNHFDYG